MLNSTNNVSTIITTKQPKKNFLGVQELVVICCFEFLTPLPPTLGGHNFLIFKFFLTSLNALDALIGGVQHFLGHQKQKSPPLGSGLP